MAMSERPDWPEAWHALWRRIAAHPFEDPGVALDFCARLAREHGWRRDEARAVIAEYRRFAFLAMVAGHEVTPSDEVDEAWHLHLAYSRDYWQRWCPEVLGAPLHHGPTLGGRAAAARYREQYAETLASYERVFGAPPPARWWPGLASRFAAPLRFRRVDTARCWLLPRPRLRLPRRLALLAGTGLMLPSLALALPANPLDWTAGPFLALYAVLALVAFAGATLWRRALRDTGVEARAAGLSPYEVAVLAGGEARAGDAAIAELFARDAVRVASDRQALELLENPAALPLPLAAAAREISHDGRIATLAARVGSRLGALRQGLVRRGLMLDADTAWRAALQPALLPAAVLLLGLAKIAVGLERDRPVGFLVILSVVLALATLGFALARPQRTRAGDAALASLKATRARALRAPRAGEVAIAVALVGTSALAGTAWAGYHDLRQPPASGGDGGSSSSTSSDGDSSDGGGSSGCGGCGGGGGD